MQQKISTVIQTELHQKEQNVKGMKRIIIILVLSLFQFSCKAQNGNFLKLDETDYDVLSKFLEQTKAYTFVDKHFFNENLIDNFISKFRYHQNFQKNADSICKFSKELDKRKFYCPLAHQFGFIRNLLDENDLKYLSENYNSKMQIQTMEIDSIIVHNQLKIHSEGYYQNINYMANSMKQNSEYPSIRIQNLYYNKNKSVAIIAYYISNNSIEMENNFFILKKMDNIWWKPLGSFKL